MWEIELKDGELPLKRQIYQTLRERITAGRIPAGEALPSTRELAKQLSVSRNTVCEAYEMLLAEGYVQSHQGAATRVAEGLVLEKPHAEAPALPQPHKLPVAADLHTGQPDLRLFPAFQWSMAMRRACEEMPISQLGYSGPQGLPQLREEISAWLFRGKGIIAPPEDIFITAGATHALHIVAQQLGEGGKGLFVEDPCHTGMLRTLKSMGMPIYPLPADEQGLAVEQLAPHPNAAAVYVTPSHQFPLGGILPAARRAALIRFARENGLYIIEDDYDSEFRYCGEPVAPLYCADPQRVIYTGTFSKVLFPALRIGYAVVPKTLQPRFKQLRTQTDVQNPVAEQAALADFMRTRRLDRHVRQMRKVYGARRQALLEALHEAFGEACRPWGDAAGLHLALQFEQVRFEDDFAAQCRQKGIRLATVEQHSIIKGRHTDKLLVGYGHLTEEEIRGAVGVVAGIMKMEFVDK